MPSKRLDTLHATREARPVKTGITQAQADAVAQILVLEYETNPTFRAYVDAKVRADSTQTAKISPSSPGRPAVRRGALVPTGGVR